MRSILLTRGMEALVDDLDFEYLSQWNWHALNGSKNGSLYYAATNWKDAIGKFHTVLMHKVIAKRMELIGKIDHKDRNGLNNQRENLRAATSRLNGHNQGVRVNNSTGYKGVNFCQKTQKYRARIAYSDGRLDLGFFKTDIEAARAYDARAKRMYGEFAVLNFPDE